MALAPEQIAMLEAEVRHPMEAECCFWTKDAALAPSSFSECAPMKDPPGVTTAATATVRLEHEAIGTREDPFVDDRCLGIPRRLLADGCDLTDLELSEDFLRTDSDALRDPRLPLLDSDLTEPLRSLR
ncbi:unnamed protein product [Heligmosomoides polygyrus]|uniref:TORC_C domain-containing protein n=1 Tax=Heligmosomoides polygyrus TaxID=6339 RepID=A0A183G8I7_HELPZ|nr:unnamed protein product [Heligmosomoides polygyrus]